MLSRTLREYLRRVVPTGGSKELTVTERGKSSKTKEFKDFTFLVEKMPGDGNCLFHTVIYAEKCLVEGTCLPSTRLKEAMDSQGGSPEVPAFEVTVKEWKDAVKKARAEKEKARAEKGKLEKGKLEKGKAEKVAKHDAEEGTGGKDPNLRVFTWKKGSRSPDQFYKQRVSDEEIVLCIMMGQPSKYAKFTVTVMGGFKPRPIRRHQAGETQTLESETFG
jgi:hypothetical protein